MKNTSSVGTIKQLIVHWAKTSPLPVIAVYGFGSFFKRQTHVQSDIDVGVLFSKPLSNVKRFELQEQLAKKCGRNIDLVDLRKTTPVMAVQIISEGTILYCSDETDKNTFETFIYSAYARFNEERKDIINDILKRGSIHG
ncbi:MAG: nucleotidyltransferase domain-containing protein [Deltaproteobacteria bacterium]|nr:nucleotidyltransferase domain-containing protein [Deltaproteobacteria bacterium]